MAPTTRANRAHALVPPWCVHGHQHEDAHTSGRQSIGILVPAPTWKFPHTRAGGAQGFSRRLAPGDLFEQLGSLGAMKSMTLSLSASAAVVQALWRTADLAHSTLRWRSGDVLDETGAGNSSFLPHDAVGRFVLTRPAGQRNRMGRADAGVRGHDRDVRRQGDESPRRALARPARGLSSPWRRTSRSWPRTPASARPIRFR